MAPEARKDSLQNLMPLAGIPRNATGLVFGRQIQESLGGVACPVGTGIHFLFSIAWPYFRERGYEATFLALIHAVIALIVIARGDHVASDSHPDYFDPVVIIGGFMSHFFFTIPLALIVKCRPG